MPKDKFKALWISHSSLSDFVKCPRSYYLKNIYKNPETRRKMMVVSPALSLGSSVHAVLEYLANIPPFERTSLDFLKLFDKEWEKYHGEAGGFSSQEQEETFKLRGYSMLANVKNNMEPIMTETVSMGDDLPYVWISDEHNIILCGKVDWISKEDNGIHIIDFKTGKNEESEDSLQLPIYSYLAREILHPNNIKISYWYLDSNKTPTLMPEPNLEEATAKILETALKIKEAKIKNELSCPRNGCFACRDYEKVFRGEAKYIGVGDFDKDIYYVENEKGIQVG